MSLKDYYSIEELNVQGKKVFMRVDFNVPLDEKGEILDDTRIRESLPSIKYLIKKNAIVILASHLGRPKGKPDPVYSLKPVAKRLSELLGKEALFVEDCIGEKVKSKISNMSPGDVLLLENLRFYSGEEKNDPQFSSDLASLAEVYINDAFGSSHRAHSSVVGMVKHFKEYGAGFLLQKEIEYLVEALKEPKKPFIAILGGSKVSDKIKVIENLLNRVDAILIGGAMAYAFLKVKGFNIGKSLLFEDDLPIAEQTLKSIASSKAEFLLPMDHVYADRIEEGAETFISEDENIPEGMFGGDVGPKTVNLFKKWIAKAKTVVWNGPMGVYEIPQFKNGTYSLIKALAESNAISIVGGGDSVAAVKESGFAHRISHLSTGGGASLELLEGKKLPGLEILKKSL